MMKTLYSKRQILPQRLLTKKEPRIQNQLLVRKRSNKNHPKRKNRRLLKKNRRRQNWENWMYLSNHQMVQRAFPWTWSTLFPKMSPRRTMMSEWYIWYCFTIIIQNVTVATKHPSLPNRLYQPLRSNHFPRTKIQRSLLLLGISLLNLAKLLMALCSILAITSHPSITFSSWNNQRNSDS